MKFSALVAAAFASLALAGPIAVPEDVSPADIEARQAIPPNGKCSTAHVQGIFCTNPQGPNAYLSICDIGGVLKFMAWCPKGCYHGPRPNCYY